MHILTGAQFADKNLLQNIFAKAAELEKADKNGGMAKLLNGKVIATLFYEPSTRTRLSFESAVLKLGGGVISVENARATSSDVKGESLEDTIKIINGYADLIVMRHPEEGTAERAAKVSAVPIINGGDGGNEHPTQALYDLYTIQSLKGRLDNLKIVFGFDPLHSRTIRSLSKLLAIYPDNKFIFISPPSLRAAPELLKELETMGAKIEMAESLEGVGDNDVLYLNRLQQERFEDAKEFEANRKLFILKPEHLKGSNAIVLDPLPRVDEIDASVDALPNAKYFEQAKNGLYIRAALLLYALGIK